MGWSQLNLRAPRPREIFGAKSSMDAAVTYGGTTVMVSRDASEPDAVYTERSWAVARALERGSHGPLSELVRLSRCYAYKRAMSVSYCEKTERRMRELFEEA